MQIESVRLHPRAAFHLGERGIGLEETSLTIHSDTLFSALCAAWQTLYGEEALTHELLPSKGVAGAWQPPFLLSSAFPFVNRVRLYPRPLLLELESDRRFDFFDEVEWVSEEIFSALLQGSRPRVDPEEELVHGGSVWLAPDEAELLRERFEVRSLSEERFWAIAKVPRVTLDVKTNASEIWHFARVVFREGCGYHFLVLYRDEGVRERFHAALRLLGDLGIGGDRTSGHGLFTPEFSPGPEWAQSSLRASAFITLSLLYPKPDEVMTLLNEGSRYRLISRSGWIGGVHATPWRRRTVRMVVEGSHLGGDPTQAWGDLVDVTPEDAPALGLLHRVYRWGFAFPVGVRT